MNILALDAATAACSVAYWCDGRVRANRLAEMERGQAECLMPMVRTVLDEARVGFADIDHLAVTVGPGAFTGLRIGLAAARGMALAAELPVTGVTTLEAVAQGVPKAERQGQCLVVALESKRADLYIQAFSECLAPLTDPVAMMPDNLLTELIPELPHEQILLAGDGSGRALRALAGVACQASSAPGVPDAVHVAAVAAARLAHGVASLPPEPLYLRQPDVTLPQARGQSRQ